MTKCKKHPKYKALWPPLASCSACRQMRIEKLVSEVRKAKTELFNLSMLEFLTSPKIRARWQNVGRP
jgi:hypothetical protein